MFRESVRDKVLYNLVLFALLLIGASFLIGQLTAGQDVKIIKDLGLAATSMFGLFIAVFIGIGLVSKEVERRSIYSLLAKPITRAPAGARQVLRPDADARRQHGRHGGRALRGAGLHGLGRSGRDARAWDAPALDPALLKAIALIFVELMLVTAIALFFSTFSTPMLSAALTFGLYIVGHFSGDLRNFQQVVDSPAAAAVRARPVLGAAEPGAVRRQERRRARPAGARRLHRA